MTKALNLAIPTIRAACDRILANAADRQTNPVTFWEIARTAATCISPRVLPGGTALLLEITLVALVTVDYFLKSAADERVEGVVPEKVEEIRSLLDQVLISEGDGQTRTSSLKPRRSAGGALDLTEDAIEQLEGGKLGEADERTVIAGFLEGAVQVHRQTAFDELCKLRGALRSAGFDMQGLTSQA